MEPLECQQLGPAQHCHGRCHFGLPGGLDGDDRPVREGEAVPVGGLREERLPSTRLAGYPNPSEL